MLLLLQNVLKKEALEISHHGNCIILFCLLLFIDILTFEYESRGFPLFRWMFLIAIKMKYISFKGRKNLIFLMIE